MYTQALLETTGTDDDCSLGGAFDRQIRWLGWAFEHYFDPRGREFERSNLQKFTAEALPRVGDRLKFRVDRCITCGLIS